MKPATTIVMILLMVIALLHAVRLLLQVEVLVGGVAIPMWVSVGGIIGPAILALVMRYEHRATPAGA